MIEKAAAARAMVASAGKCALSLLTGFAVLALPACGLVSNTYRLGKGAVETAYDLSKGAAETAAGAGKAVYKIGEFTFRVAVAPLSWPLAREEIESIDGLSPKQAIEQGRVKNSSYVIKGKQYVPMSVQEAAGYREEGVASWYGYETCPRGRRCMTANGEVFDPDGFNAAHKHLPLPAHVKVTNLENGRFIIVRVNDRGPFIPGRIIDLSAGSARRLGFHKKGTARVLVETVEH